MIEKNAIVPDFNAPNMESLDSTGKDMLKLVHKTIKSVSRDVSPELYSFNTAIARCHELNNAFYKYTAEKLEADNAAVTDAEKALISFAVKNLLLMLAPMAPHISEQLWHDAGFAKTESESIHKLDDRVQFLKPILQRSPG